MCEHGKTKNVWVKIPADLSCTGFDRFRVVAIDECIAPIVNALQQAGIDMRGSCCGHGKADGYITLQDGRELIIKKSDDKFKGYEVGKLVELVK